MSNVSPTTAAKRKQMLTVFGILGCIAGLSAVGVIIAGDGNTPSPSTTSKDIQTKNYIAPGEKVNPEDAWRGVSDNRLNLLENEMNQLKQENETLKRQLAEGPSSNTLPSTQSPESMSDDELDRRLRNYERQSPPSSPVAPVGSSGYPGSTPVQPTAAQPVAGPVSMPQSDAAASGRAVPPIQPMNAIVTVKLNNPIKSVAADQRSVDETETIKTTKNYLPSGTFGQAVVLSGLDAPTGGQAQSNPQPVLLQLRDLSILPNRYRYNWKECFISGAGYGDISSERAHLRLESLSCVSKDGRVLDVQLRGYVAGEDGKAGMRGRLVSKQGQALANGLLAGVVSGIGSGIQTSTSTVSVSPLGSTTTVSEGDALKAGIGEGVAKSMDRLANYYISLAEKMFPVIEVDAGRIVDVVLTKGVFLDAEVKANED